MYNLTYIDKRELKYINRKVRLDNTYEWKDEDIQKIKDLNSDVEKLQEALRKFREGILAQVEVNI